VTAKVLSSSTVLPGVDQVANSVDERLLVIHNLNLTGRGARCGLVGRIVSEESRVVVISAVSDDAADGPYEEADEKQAEEKGDHAVPPV
jgi:hypothetical protein